MQKNKVQAATRLAD